jgi:hypothetical protein
LSSNITAQNWTGINGVPSTVTTQFSVAGDGAHQMTAPDGTLYKEYYGDTWKRGLVTMAEVLNAGLRKRTTTAWTQDNESVNYQMNPRVRETNVCDATSNCRRTQVEQFAQFGLPQFIVEYAADGQTWIRRTHLAWALDSHYVERRIIGLLFQREVFDGSWTPMERTQFWHDVGPSYMEGLPVGPTQHDGAQYPAGFIWGRGNLAKIRRYDVTDYFNENKVIETHFGYNITGSVIFSRDGSNHETRVSYDDVFSDAPNSNTFAYPTKVKDADWHAVTAPNNFSTTQYNFAFGAITRTQGPPPAGQVQGLIQTTTYDAAGRVDRVTTDNNSAYEKYIYGPNYIQKYSTVNVVSDESYSIQYFDGVGRPIDNARNHPGSTGGYSAQTVDYDLMGRVMKKSNPTEISPSWFPAGDDTYWYYTNQTYDWQGRPLRTTHPDNTYKEASYSSCGCSGSEVVTLTDEGTIDGGTPKRRQQKIYSDVLGRTWKTEVLNWQGGSSYATTVTTYNGRDQVKQVRQWAGAEGTGAYQDTTMEYDGYGRLKTKRLPEQTAATVYNYNADDTVSSISDARGVTSIFTYNGRHLQESITYPLPQNLPSGVSETPNVTLLYDAAGNRTSMTEKDSQNNVVGSTVYEYNQISRMTSEIRTFPGLGSYELEYDYNLAGQLKKLTYPPNIGINYNYDLVGRLSSVTGSDTLYNGITQYASNFVYRAWDGVKQMTDGAGRTELTTYDVRLQAAHFEISGNVVSQNYERYDDGRIKFVNNLTDHNFDRSYGYDHLGRITEAGTGDAAGQGSTEVPSWQTFGYDALGNTTSRYTELWLQDEFVDGASYTNRRRSGWGYDADGRVKTIDTRNYKYDAAGNQIEMTGQVWSGTHYIPTSMANSYDGDGNKVKEVSTYVTSLTTHYLTSTVLKGAIVQEINSAGQTTRFVFTPDGRLLTRLIGPAVWKHEAPSGASLYETYQSGLVQRIELDPVDADIPLTAPPPAHQGEDGDIRTTGGSSDSRYGNIGNPAAGCVQYFGGEGPCFTPGMSLTWLTLYHQTQKQPIGSRDSGVRYGRRFSANYDLKGRLISLYEGPRDPELGDLSYSTTTLLYSVSSWFSVGPQNPAPNVDDLENRIRKMVSKKPCADFIKNLINLTATSANPAEFTDALKGLEKIKGPGQGGFVYGDTIKKFYGFDGGTVRGSIGGGKAQVELPYPSPNRITNPRMAVDFANWQGRIQAETALHEILHLAGKNQFSDFDFARTVAAMRGVTPPTFANARKASDYWNDALIGACSPRK